MHNEKYIITNILYMFKYLFDKFSCSKQHLTILIGKEGVTISIIKNNILLDQLFLSNKDKINISNYTRILKKYRATPITILLDTNTCILKHETMPIIQSIIDTNPIDEYLYSNIPDDNLVAYNIYKISYIKGETWDSTVMTTSYSGIISKLLNYLIINSYRFQGAYFLVLEFEKIIDYLMQITGNDQYDSHIQFFVTITKASGLRIIVKHDKDIMYEKHIEYPKRKSIKYIQGTIEQLISDSLDIFKHYIKKQKAKTCLIILSTEELKELFTQIDFAVSNTILLSHKDINQNELIIDQSVDQLEHFDHLLIDICSNTKKYKIYNIFLKKFAKLNRLNNLIFIPFILIILAFSTAIATLKYHQLNFHHQNTIIKKQYLKLHNQYKDTKKKYGNIEHFDDLVDFYILKLSLQNLKILSPIKELEIIDKIPQEINCAKSTEIIFNKIEWSIVQHDMNNNPYNIQINMNLNFDFINNSIYPENDAQALTCYLNNIKSHFKNSKIQTSQDYFNKRQLPTKVIIPIQMNIIKTIK